MNGPQYKGTSSIFKTPDFIVKKKKKQSPSRTLGCRFILSVDKTQDVSVDKYYSMLIFLWHPHQVTRFGPPAESGFFHSLLWISGVDS